MVFTSSRIKEAAKELEQRLAAKQAQVERYSQAFGELAGKKQKVKNEFERIEKAQEELDKSLTQVVGAVKETREAERERTRQEQELFSDLKEFTDDLKRSGEGYTSLKEDLKGQCGEMFEIVEHNKHFTEPARFLNQVPGEILQELEQMKECLSQMQEFGRQMGVISLNAAIEAGRMGDSGTKFVGAAEEVRSLAGQYQNAAETMNGQVEKIGGQLTETQDRVTRLNQLLKENNVTMGKTAQGVSDCLERLEQGDLMGAVPRVESLTAEAEELLSAHEKDSEDFAVALSAMEQAGERFIQEQQAVDALKAQWETMKKLADTFK